MTAISACTVQASMNIRPLCHHQQLTRLTQSMLPFCSVLAIVLRCSSCSQLLLLCDVRALCVTVPTAITLTPRRISESRLEFADACGVPNIVSKNGTAV